MNTVVVDFYLPHLREAIIELEKAGVIKNKFWLVDPKYNDGTVPSMHNNMICQEDIHKYYTFIPDDIYDNIHESIYRFMNIENRWVNSIELADYVHDFNVLSCFWYGVFYRNNIDLLIMGNAPHGSIPFVAYLVAKAMNLKIIVCEQIYQLRNSFICADSIDTMGNVKINLDVHENEKLKIKKEFKKDLFYMKDKSPLLLASERRLSSIIHNFNLLKKRKYDIDFVYKGMEKIGYCLISKKLESYFKRHRDEKCQEVLPTDKYVYFPLHLQPEMTTDTLGGIYEDQLLAIERLRRIIPSEWYIYIKENPKQTYYKRSKKFFERLSLIPNVKIVYPNTNTWDLTANSQFVATITGTVGWEAITGGKNVLIFGNAWYRTLPGVFEYKKDFNLQNILNYRISHEELEAKFNDFMRKICVGVVAGDDFKEFNPSFDEKTNNEQVFRSLKVVIEKWYKQ